MNKVQQYRRIIAHPLSEKIGQFVMKGDTNHVIGFISDTDGIMYVEVTLFQPAEGDSFLFNIFNTVPEVDWEDVFVSIVDRLGPVEFNNWKKLYDVN